MIEHRSLFGLKDRVPDVPYRVRFGRAVVRRRGEQVSLVAVSNMVPFAMRVAEMLAAEKVNAEVLDLRTVAPLDHEAVARSVEKTGRLVVLDPAWLSFGVAAEVVARVAERLGRRLRADPLRICHPDSHTPMSSALETVYYPREAEAVKRIRALVA
jgi:pyruvate dehydrogenase E1 component beta subunit